MAASLSPSVIVASRRAPAPDEAWIGLGSNLGDRASHVAQAVEALGASVVATSPLYETSPWGIVEQPWFLNGVARLDWSGTARDLLDRCLEIERQLGRVRYLKFGPRIIDLDVLLVGPATVSEPELAVPHPGIARRRSVLEPWADLAPELLVPGLDATVGALRERARDLPDQEVRPPTRW